MRIIGLLQAGQKNGLCKLVYNMDRYAFCTAEWLESPQKRPTAQITIKIKVKMNQAKKITNHYNVIISKKTLSIAKL